MKIRLLVLLPVALLIFSCAGGPEISNNEPEWLSSPPEKSDSVYFFRASSTGKTFSAAESAAVAELIDSVKELMHIPQSADLNDKAKKEIDAYFEKLRQLLMNREYEASEGITVIHRDSWKNIDGTLNYAIEISWEKDRFNSKKEYFSEFFSAMPPEYLSAVEKAKKAEADDNVYESAQYWVIAAAAAKRGGGFTEYRKALEKAGDLIGNVTLILESYPDAVYAGLRPEKPVVFRAVYNNKPVKNAELLIRYTKMALDNTPAVGKAGLITDENGKVFFRLPEVSVKGTQSVSAAFSAEPFLNLLGSEIDDFAGKFISIIEAPVVEASFEALPRTSTIPTGIFILETDLAGNPLDSDSAAKGLFDDLKENGFNVAILDLDPEEMSGKSEEAILRDLKADKRFSSKFERVVLGKIVLDKFEQKDSGYTVKVSGTLYLSDIERQINLYKSTISKTSRASSSSQAMSAAFRQLGRTFAEEIIKQAP